VFAVKPERDILPFVPPQVVGFVEDVVAITGVGGLESVIGPAAAEVQPLIVTVMLE
jgi:hypothetical protein